MTQMTIAKRIRHLECRPTKTEFNFEETSYDEHFVIIKHVPYFSREYEKKINLGRKGELGSQCTAYEGGSLRCR